MTLSGTEMPNHMTSSSSSVKNGTAPVEPLTQSSKLSAKKTANEHPENKKGRPQRHTLLVRAAQPGVRPRRDVAAHRARQHPQGQHGRQEPTAVRGRQEADERKHERHRAHAQDLRAGPDEDAEEAAGGGRAEDVAVDEFPPALLLDFLVVVNVIVPRKVEVHSAQKDHRHHRCQEQRDQQRVDDGKPLDLLHSLLRGQQRVPPRRPFDGRLPELHVVRPDYRRGASLSEAHLFAFADRARRELLLPFDLDLLVGDSLGDHLKADDALLVLRAALVERFRNMVFYSEAQMIEQTELFFFWTCPCRYIRGDFRVGTLQSRSIQWAGRSPASCRESFERNSRL